MAYDIVVQLPVTVPFGTDEEFDLRVRLQRELAEAFRSGGDGRAVAGEIDADHILLRLEGLDDPQRAFELVRGVLGRGGLLERATVVLESALPNDPDERVSRVLWPPDPAPALRFG